MPYGLFTPITKEEQVAIINSARRITNRLIIVTFEDMSEVIKKSGFNIIDTGHVAKGKFKRYISVCIQAYPCYNFKNYNMGIIFYIYIFGREYLLNLIDTRIR